VLRSVLALFALTVVLIGVPAWAAAEDPEQVRAQLREVTEEIGRLQQQRADRLRERNAVQSALADSERQLSAIERRRRQLDAERSAADAALADLQHQAQAEQKRLQVALHEVGLQLALVHRQGQHAALRHLLNQNSPQRVSRQLTYHRHLLDARQRSINELSDTLRQLRNNATEQSLRRDELVVLQREQGQLQDDLKTAVAERSRRLAAAEAELDSTQAQLQQRQIDAAALEALLEELAALMAALPQDEELPRITTLRGQLQRPVEAQVIEGFGQSRGGESRRSGWVMAAAPGSEVRAAAHGRVAFADWLRGYGLLLILDHGDGVMSLYGQNQSVLRQVGDWVRTGEVIAVTGELDRGFYFEIRENGRPVNPSRWLQPAGG
jgi:septal ring factor EnvC (AmiA/AmiB activator)